MPNIDRDPNVPDPKVIVALDYQSQAEALALAEQLDPDLCRVKVGKELFTYAGPAVVEALQARGLEVFLDLKFHDIPNTTAAAVRAAASLGVWMVNVHASGGLRMLNAAREAIDKSTHQPLLIGVTVLTSMESSDLQELGISRSPLEQVLFLAQLCQQAGLDGVVCSAHEAERLKAQSGQSFKLVTPGIRPAEASSGDQRRVMTPAKALRAGSDYLVIGRPITQAADPAQALEKVAAEIAGIC